MGGNALQTVKTVRLPANLYHPFATRVAARLEAAWPEARPYVIPAYASKPDFGDLDLVVDAAGVPEDAQEQLRALFNSRELVRNGSVTSLEVDGFQVDVIQVDRSAYRCACAYFSYNDAGNLMGRLARAMGFKFGWDGLFYPLRDGNRLIAQIPVSQDPRDILDFLGYDFEEFVYGFQTLEQMFAFVASSPFFDPARYALQTRNHTARVRDRKRASYRAFLEWLDREQPPTGALVGREPTWYLARAGRRFPALRGQLADALVEHQRRRQRRERFNGDIVAGLTDLTGKALGALMQEIRSGFPGGASAFDAWLDANPGEAAVRAEIEAAQARLHGAAAAG